MKNQPEEHEIQAEYYEAYKYPWLEKVFDNTRRESGARQQNIMAIILLSKVTFFYLYCYYAFMNILFLTLSHQFKQAILNTRNAMTFITNLSFELRDGRV
jgi:hypothetical protein